MLCFYYFCAIYLCLFDGFCDFVSVKAKLTIKNSSNMSNKKFITTSFVGLLSSVLAFLGIISCCGLPLIAAFLAWFGIGASQLSFLSEYQYLFTGIATTALLYGFYTIYFKKEKESNSAACCSAEEKETTGETNCCTPSKNSSLLEKVMLWIGVVAVATTFFMDNDKTSNTQQGCCPTEVPEPSKQLKAKSSCCPTAPSNTSQSEQSIAPEKKTTCCPK